METTTGRVAELVAGSLEGDASLPVGGVASAGEALAGQVTFAENERMLALALRGRATAILVGDDIPSPAAPGAVLIRVPDARLAMARLIEHLHPEPSPPPAIHPRAQVHPEAEVHPRASIGPGCTVDAEAVIGAGTVLEPGVRIGARCRVGEDCRLYPNVVLYPRSVVGHRVRIHAGTVIGSDGYGYVLDGERHRKIPQVGGVRIGDDVEMGANVTVDRGALGDTVIGEGTRIDNLVQIAHNVVIGRHCLIIAQAGIAGSTTIGDHAVIAGQAGIAGHLTIGNRVTIAAQSGVMNHLADGQQVFGSPAQPDKETKRQILALRRLPELLRRFTRLEKRLSPPERPE